MIEGVFTHSIVCNQGYLHDSIMRSHSIDYPSIAAIQFCSTLRPDISSLRRPPSATNLPQCLAGTINRQGHTDFVCSEIRCVAGITVIHVGYTFTGIDGTGTRFQPQVCR